MHKRDEELVFRFFNEIGIIAQLSSTMFERALPNGLTVSQFGVLNWFATVDDEATPGRLAKAFQVTPGAMTNTLRKLKDKRLVTVETDASSARRKLVRITPEGEAMRARALGSAQPLFERFSAEFGTDDLAQHVARLAVVRQYLDEHRD